MILENRRALITGGGQGVGQGIALALAKEGASVAITGRSLEKLEKTCKMIEAIGGKAFAIQNDVKELDSLEKTVEQALSALGGLDILVNNAQQVPLGNLLDVEEKNLEAGWQSGPLACFRLMKLCHPHLKASGNASIVNLASTAAKRWDSSGYGAYAAVKEAIRALTRAAACEWAVDGIRSNVILPHAKSPGLEWWINNYPEQAEAFIQSIPMKRIGDCEQDIGRFVATLCSDASAYINGQSIAVDGGQAFMG